MKKKKTSGKKIALIVLIIVLSVVLVGLVAATIYVDWVLDRFHDDPVQNQQTLSSEEVSALLTEPTDETEDPTAVTVDPDALVWADAEPIESSSHIFNFMLVGQDRRPGEKRARSDSMILITVNTETKQLYMTSVMRDLYVKIPGFASNRMNVPYAIKGAELLFDTMEKNFGLRPEHYIEVDFNGFTSAIEMMGGVDIHLTRAEARHLNSNEAYYGFPNEQWALVEGLNHLTGNQALSYARCRNVDGSGDFNRTRRQRDVLNALVEKAKTMSMIDLHDLVIAMGDYIATDMTSAEIISYAAAFAPMLKDLQIVNQRIPADNTYYLGNVEGIGSVIIADLEKNRNILAESQK